MAGEINPESFALFLAAAALGRLLCLLEALIAVCDAGQARVAGVLLRAQWETHLVGLYLMLAGPDAVKELASDRAAWAPGIAKTWNVGGPWHETVEAFAKWAGDVRPAKLNYAALSVKVEDLLKAKGLPIDLKTTHHRIYKSESTYTAHPSFEGLLRHLKTLDEVTSPDVSFEPSPTRASYLSNSAWAVGALAEPVFAAFKVPYGSVDAALTALQRLEEGD